VIHILIPLLASSTTCCLAWLFNMSFKAYKDRLVSVSKINDNFLTCEICGNSFTSERSSPRAPKTLNCLHTYCRECLANSIARTPGALEFECFVCKGPTPIDKALGVDSIKTNFMLQNLIATCQPSSAETDESAVPPPITTTTTNSTTATTTTSTDVSATDSKTVFKFERGGVGGEGGAGSIPCEQCIEDANSVAEFYCQQCEESLCASCNEIHVKIKKIQGSPMCSSGIRQEECQSQMPCAQVKVYRICLSDLRPRCFMLFNLYGR